MYIHKYKYIHIYLNFFSRLFASTVNFIPQEMLRYTPEEHPDYAYTKEALAKMQGIAEKLNESRRKAENKEKVQTITKCVPERGVKRGDADQETPSF